MHNMIYLGKLKYLSNLINLKVFKKWKYPPSHACQWQPISHHKAEFRKTEKSEVEKGGERSYSSVCKEASERASNPTTELANKET